MRAAVPTLIMAMMCVLLIVPPLNAQAAETVDASEDPHVSIMDMNMTSVDNSTVRMLFVLSIDLPADRAGTTIMYPLVLTENGTNYSQCNGATPEIHIDGDGIVGVCTDIDEGVVPTAIKLVDGDGDMICVAHINSSFDEVLGIDVIVYNSNSEKLLFVFDNEVDSLSADSITLYTEDGTVISLEGADSGLYTDNIAWYHLELDDVTELYVDIRFDGVVCDVLFLGTNNLQAVIV